MKTRLLNLLLLAVILGLLLSGCAEEDKCKECVDSDGDGLCDVCESDTPTADTPDTPDVPVTPNTPNTPNIPSTPNSPNVSLCQHRDADDDYFCDTCGESYADLKDVYDEPSDGPSDNPSDVPSHDPSDEPDASVCAHIDENKDGLCDECELYVGYTDDVQPVLQWNEILERGYFVCGVTVNENMNMKNDDGTWTGLESEFAKEVAGKLGINVLFEEIEPSEKYNMLISGEIDCIWSGFVINDTDNGIKRTELVDYSHGYSLDSQCLVLKGGIDWVYEGLGPLKYKIGCAVAGGAGEQFIATYGNPEYSRLADTPEEAIEAFSDSNGGYLVINKEYVTDYLRENYVVMDGVPIESDVTAVGFRRGSDLTERFNSALKALSESGRLAEIADSYGYSFEFYTDVPFIHEPLDFYGPDFIMVNYEGTPENNKYVRDQNEFAPFMNVVLPTADKLLADGCIDLDLILARLTDKKDYVKYSDSQIKITAEGFLITSVYGQSAENTLSYVNSIMHATDVTGSVGIETAREGYYYLGFNEPLYLNYLGNGAASGKIVIDVTGAYSNRAFIYYATDGRYIAFSVVSAEKAAESLGYRTVSDYSVIEKEVREIPEEPERTVIGTAVSTRTGELELTVSTPTLFPQKNGELLIDVKSNYDIPVDVKIEIKASAVTITDEGGESADGLLKLCFEMNGEPTVSRKITLSTPTDSSKSGAYGTECRVRFIVYDKDGVEIDNVALSVYCVKYYNYGSISDTVQLYPLA